MYYHVMNGLIPFVLSNYDELLYVRTTIDIDTPTSVQCILRDLGAYTQAVRVMKCDVSQRQCAKIRIYVNSAHALICSTMTKTLVKTVPP